MAGSTNQRSGVSELTFEQIAFQTYNQMDEAKNWYVLGGSADFSAILPKLRLIKEGDEAAILIRPFIHNMVVYMRVMDSKIKCFIADSQGWNWRYYPTRNLIAALNEHFGERAQIVLPTTPLQAREVNRGCSIFAQLFLKYFTEKGKHFFQELANLPINTEENQKLKEKIKGWGIALRSEIILLQKDSLPLSLISRLNQNFSTTEAFFEGSPWLKGTMTIQTSLLMEQDNKFQKETQGIVVANEEMLPSLLKWQHLDHEDLEIGVEESSIYQLEINKIGEKYAFKVNFGKGNSGQNQIMFGNCIAYANVNFPKDVTSENLQTIFADMKPEIRVDMHESSLTIYADSEEELLTFFSKKLLSKEYQLQLYRQGMTQQLALSFFAYEALECVKMSQRKHATTGGLFLGEVNAALLYFITAYGRDTIGVVQESLGFKNEKLLQKIIDLMDAGKGKIVFSIDAGKTHQVAVIIDKKTEKISVIDSHGLDQGLKNVEKLLGSHSYFKKFTFSSEKPPVLQETDHWTCGVHVILNILDDLGEIADRKNIDMDEWLRKILRASEVTERENLQRQDKMIVRDRLIDAVIELHEQNELLMPSLILFLKSHVRDSSLVTFGELKQQENYKSLNLTEKEKDVLHLIYSLTEANFEQGVAERIIGSGLKFIARPESEIAYIEFKEKGKKNSDLATQISNLLEEQYLNEHLDQLKSVSSKKSRLLKWFESLISHKLTIKDFVDSEALTALTTWIDKEGNKSNISTEKLYSWLDYLLFNKLNLLVIKLLENERSAWNEAKKQKYSIETLRNQEIQLGIDKISKLLGLQDTQEHKDILQWLSQLKGKLFLIPPQGWEKIIRAARFDIILLDTIIKDHENTEYSNFFLSAIKTLLDKGDEEQALQLCHDPYIQENLKGNFGILEASLLMPASSQEKFLRNNLKTIESYFVFLNQQTGKPIPSLESLSELTTKNVMQLFLEMINYKDFDDYTNVLGVLPTSLNVYLLKQAMPPIVTIEQLGLFLLTLPETRRLAVIKTYYHLITEEYLAPVIDTLPTHIRYDFLNDYLQSKPKTYLFYDNNLLAILKNLTSNDIDRLVKNYPQFLRNIHVLSGVIKKVLNDRAIHYAETYQNLISSAQDLQKILTVLPSEYHSKFIEKNSQLIATPLDASLIMPFIAIDKKLAFIEKYKDKIATIKDVVALAQNLSEGEKGTFIKPYLSLIKDGYELSQITAFLRQDEMLDFIIKRIDLVHSAGELLALLRVVRGGFLDIINEFKISLFRKPITKDQIDTVGKILLFIPPENRGAYALKFSSDITTIDYLSALLITLKEEERLQHIKSVYEVNNNFDFQSSEQIGKTLFILPVHDRIPFLEYLLKSKVVKSLAEKSRFKSMDILLYLSSTNNSEMISAEDTEAIKQKLDSVIITASSIRDYGFHSVKSKHGEEVPEEPQNKKEF